MKYFVDSVGKKFVVDELEPSDNGVWVHYHRVEDGAEFSCLLDAFKERFKELAE
jgi:hypothetical protein